MGREQKNRTIKQKNMEELVLSTIPSFKRSQLAQYKVIRKPGKGTLICATSTSERNRVVNENGRESYIVSFKAIAADKLPALIDVFKDSEEVEIEKTNGLFMSGNIWVNQGSHKPLPMKGEEVEVMIDLVPSRDGGPVLRIRDMRVQEAEEFENLNIAALLSPADKATIVADAIREVVIQH